MNKKDIEELIEHYKNLKRFGETEIGKRKRDLKGRKIRENMQITNSIIEGRIRMLIDILNLEDKAK